MALYKAPVIKAQYKQIVSHFSKPKKSFNGERLAPIEQQKTTNNPSFEQSAPLFHGPYLAESKDHRLTSGKINKEILVTSDVPNEKRNRMDLEQPTSPTPFSDQEDGSTRQPDLASSGKKAVHIGSHRSSPN